MDWQYGDAQCRIPHGLPAPHEGLRNFMNEVISLMPTCPPPQDPRVLLAYLRTHPQCDKPSEWGFFCGIWLTYGRFVASALILQKIICQKRPSLLL